MTVRIIADVLIAIGAIFALAGTIGILKMPDTFSRMQASTCIPTLGTICALLGWGPAIVGVGLLLISQTIDTQKEYAEAVAKAKQAE